MSTTAEPDLFPIRGARFTKGRTEHKVKQPEQWYHLLEAKCGKSGYLARGYPSNKPRPCTGCYDS